MNIEAILWLLELADGLRRTNADKWRLSLIDWEAAVNEALSALSELQRGKSEATVEAIQAARNAVRRLANSGEARFASASHGSDPNSSLAGRRFDDDLETMHRRFEVLRDRVTH